MPDNLHRVLIIGAGSIGERHLRCFQKTDRCDVALVEINADLRRGVAERYGLKAAFASLDEALQHRHDAAVIATPAPWHVPMAVQLAEAGIHLLIEKPLSTSLEGVDRLLETVQRTGITAGMAYVLRHHPLIRSLRQAIQSGLIGTPVELVAVTGQNFPTYRPAYRTIYYRDRATGGGAIQDALTHLINAGEWLTGPVTRLVADAAHQVLEGVEVEDTVHVLARQGRVLSSYSLNQHQAPNEFTLSIIGERGVARCELHAGRWRWITEPDGTWQEETIPPLERDTLFVAQANAFLDAIKRRGAMACSLQEGLQTLRVNLAALASADSGQWQSIP